METLLKDTLPPAYHPTMRFSLTSFALVGAIAASHGGGHVVSSAMFHVILSCTYDMCCLLGVLGGQD